MSAIALQDLRLKITLRNGEAEFDAVEVSMFIQQVIDDRGEQAKDVRAYEIVPAFQQWASDRMNVSVEYGEAWEIMKVCQQKFEEAKKKFVS